MAFDKPRDELNEKILESIDVESMTPYDKKKIVKKLERDMKKQAEEMNFELAIRIRDKIRELQA